jgi:hypothetical protein
VHWQLTFAAIGRTRLYPRAVERLAAVRTVARVGGDALRLFSIVDEHVHTVVAADRVAAGHLASAMARALGALPGAATLAPVHVSAVNGRSHLETLVRYLIQQPHHHGISVHPALWSGACLPDLAGARRIPGFDRQGIIDDLPRLDIAGTALRCAGIVERLVPSKDADLRSLGASRLWAAVLDACGRTELTSRDDEAVGTIGIRSLGGAGGNSGADSQCRQDYPGSWRVISRTRRLPRNIRLLPRFRPRSRCRR